MREEATKTPDIARFSARVGLFGTHSLTTTVHVDTCSACSEVVETCGTHSEKPELIGRQPS